jgi:uncharacterized protein (TIGR04255 family)
MGRESSELLNQSTTFPEYDHPPVTEVVLSVQFETLPRLKGPLVGLLWTRFRDRFPESEEHPPLPSVVETFGVNIQEMNVQFELMDSMPAMRTWFLTEPGDQLLQVQQDRFVHNWRKRAEADEYPRFDNLASSFREELIEFARFIDEEGIGEIAFTQCEVTYVNHIVGGEDWNIHEHPERLLRVWSGKYSDEFLPAPEDARVAIRYVVPGQDGNPLGRLHIAANPAFLVRDKKPVMVLTLTSRCKPIGQGLDAANSALNIGHEWIVRGFTSITTQEMHEVWGRRR